MSLATTIGAGALLGTVLAVGVYNVVAPSDAVPASVEVAPTYAPVPTPTVTEEAEDCVDPAVLEDDECVVHKPGPTVTLAPARAPAPVPATTTHRESGTKGTSDSHEYGDDDSQGEEYGDDSRGEDESEHEGDHEDGDHEDGDHEDDHEDDGDEHDD